MTTLGTLIQLDAESAQPVYLQLSNGLIQLIQSGLLKPGSRLPSIRDLAVQLELHPKTVVAAYEEMEAQDWVYTKPRSGVIVAENLPELKPRTFKGDLAKNTFDGAQPVPAPDKRIFKYVINDGFPDYRIAPVSQLLKHYKAAYYDGQIEQTSILSDPAGSPRLRTALARIMGESRGLRIGPENLLITRGAQMAIYLAAATLIRPGDEVLVGEPGYNTANRTFEQLGAKLVRIPVDKDGIDVDGIERVCITGKPKLLYVIPHHHHPTTVTLSAARRMKLLGLIRKYRLHVIEDDYDYEFHYTHKPILPLASADHGGQVRYIGSLTKNLSPSIRVGYLIASEKVIGAATGHKQHIDIRGDSLMEDAIAALYENGTMQRHLRRSVKLYEQRRDLFCALLQKELGAGVCFDIPDGGMAVWARFDRTHPLTTLSAQVAPAGLWMKDGAFYNSGSVDYNAIRMGFASLAEAEITAVVAILRKAMQKK